MKPRPSAPDFSNVCVREEIVIAKGGQPCVRLVPLDTLPQRVLERYRDRDGEVADSVFAPLSQEDLAAWEDKC